MQHATFILDRHLLEGDRQKPFGPIRIFGLEMSFPAQVGNGLTIAVKLVGQRLDRLRVQLKPALNQFLENILGDPFAAIFVVMVPCRGDDAVPAIRRFGLVFPQLRLLSERKMESFVPRLDHSMRLHCVSI